MATATVPGIAKLTAQDLTDRFGPISLRRICVDSWPGTATEEDFLTLINRKGKLYELVDGIIVEKPMGLPEAFLAGVILKLLCAWVDPRKLGFVFPGDGMMRLAPGVVRYPGVSFIRASRFPGGRVQLIQVPDLVPDLAVEVLSPSNTVREMESKRRDYFTNGTQLVWQVDPAVELLKSSRARSIPRANGRPDPRWRRGSVWLPTADSTVFADLENK